MFGQGFESPRLHRSEWSNLIIRFFCLGGILIIKKYLTVLDAKSGFEFTDAIPGNVCQPSNIYCMRPELVPDNRQLLNEQ